MSAAQNSPGRPPRPALSQSDVTGLKYFKLLGNILHSLRSHKDCPNRQLHYDQLAALILLRFFNPVLGSLRALVQASDLDNVRRKLGVKHVSLGSLSESARVFDPKLLHDLFCQLAAGIADQPAPPGLPPELALVAVDGTLIKALPRMAWALWLDGEHHALKVHLEFNVLKGIPQAVEITDGNGNEKDILEAQLQPNKLYALDAGYGRYSLLEAIRACGSSFVVRLGEGLVFETVEERPLTSADQAAGLISDQVAWIGSAKGARRAFSAPLRLLRLRLPEPVLPARVSRPTPGKNYRHRVEELWLVSDRLDLPAETIALLYKHRWQIEVFFRWLKHLLGLKHLVFESPEGVSIQIYCALIASLLISLWTGRKPTKRTLEMIQLYFQGWASEEELEAHIERLALISK